jgi:hypothetical protein
MRSFGQTKLLTKILNGLRYGTHLLNAVGNRESKTQPSLTLHKIT